MNCNKFINLSGLLMTQSIHLLKLRDINIVNVQHITLCGYDKVALGLQYHCMTTVTHSQHDCYLRGRELERLSCIHYETANSNVWIPQHVHSFI